MFDYVKIFIDQFIDYLPEITIFALVLSIIGHMVYKR